MLDTSQEVKDILKRHVAEQDREIAELRRALRDVLDLCYNARKDNNPAGAIAAIHARISRAFTELRPK